MSTTRTSTTTARRTGASGPTARTRVARTPPTDSTKVEVGVGGTAVTQPVPHRVATITTTPTSDSAAPSPTRHQFRRRDAVPVPTWAASDAMGLARRSTRSRRRVATPDRVLRRARASTVRMAMRTLASATIWRAASRRDVSALLRATADEASTTRCSSTPSLLPSSGPSVKGCADATSAVRESDDRPATLRPDRLPALIRSAVPLNTAHAPLLMRQTMVR